MPTFIVKPKRDEDFYVLWSTVVDAPTGYGMRAELIGPFGGPAERFDRADEYGTSMQDPDLPRDRQWFGWHDESFLLMNCGPDAPANGVWRVPRANVRDLCERLGRDADVTDLLVAEVVEQEGER